MRRKNIAVFLDGTCQCHTPETAAKWSNVVLLHDALRTACGKALVQTRKYIDGVGTRSGEALTGGGFGIGLDERVEEAYNFLYQEVNNAKEDGDDPHLYLFGFSRGAYAARWLASLIQFSGIPKDGMSPRTLFANHRDGDRKAADGLRREGRVWDDVPVDFMGLWDTVEESVNPSFDITDIPGLVGRARHALALDEWRYSFNPTRFNPSDKVDEAWFPGSHSDVGGGYDERGLANAPLRWVAAGASAAGLAVDEAALTAAQAKRSSSVVYHDELADGSLSAVWKACNLDAGYAGKFFRTVGAHDELHPSLGWYAAAAPTGRATVPDTCVVLSVGPQRDGTQAIA